MLKTENQRFIKATDNKLCKNYLYSCDQFI